MNDIEYSKVSDGLSDAPELQQAFLYRFWLQKTKWFRALLLVVAWLCIAAIFGIFFFFRGRDSVVTRDVFPRSKSVGSYSSSLNTRVN